MFEPQPWNPKTYSEDCHKKYGIRPDFDKIVTKFGGKDYISVTNVIFTNGMRDPLSKGGGSLLHTNDSAPTQIVINIPMAVHQEDLRPAGPNDTPQIKAAREEILRIIKIWIIEYYGSIENCPKEWQGYFKDIVPESNKD